jgi:ubiquinone/menaquinone biosynthesis C-methylase UbiE
VAGRLFALLAFGPAARLYEALTKSLAWRDSCVALARLVPGPRVLDVGVGPGESSLAPAASGRRPVGLDLSMAVLRRAAERARLAGRPLPLVRADAVRLPVRDGVLDGATGHSVLYLVDDPAATVAELWRVVRPGGRVAFLEPSAARPPLREAWRHGPRFAASMALWGTMSGLHRRFSTSELSSLLGGAGFAEVEVVPALEGFGLLASAQRARWPGPVRG